MLPDPPVDVESLGPVDLVHVHQQPSVSWFCLPPQYQPIPHSSVDASSQVISIPR